MGGGSYFILLKVSRCLPCLNPMIAPVRAYSRRRSLSSSGNIAVPVPFPCCPCECSRKLRPHISVSLSLPSSSLTPPGIALLVLVSVFFWDFSVPTEGYLFR